MFTNCDGKSPSTCGSKWSRNLEASEEQLICLRTILRRLSPLHSAGAWGLLGRPDGRDGGARVGDHVDEPHPNPKHGAVKNTNSDYFANGLNKTQMSQHNVILYWKLHGRRRGGSYSNQTIHNQPPSLTNFFRNISLITSYPCEQIIHKFGDTKKKKISRCLFLIQLYNG